MAASPNDTVITAGNGSITDNSGSVWTVANGQIDVNGTPDPTTANVIEAAFVGGDIWQENASDLWWMKTKPSDTWLPAAGTSTSPLPVSMAPITLTWVGGPDNAASNPKDWSPNAAPQQGDTLDMSSGTINVTDNDLAGNPLTLVAPNSTQPFQDLINLANGTARLTDGGDNFTLTTSDSVATKFVGGNGVGFTGDIALAPNTTVTMTGMANFLYGLAVAGGSSSTLVNDGTVGLTNATVTTNLDGTGTFNLTRYHDGPGSVTINGNVGSGLTFNLNGGAGFQSSLTIDQPSTFSGQIKVPANGPDGKPGQDTVHLEGLTATSYTLANGTLTLFNGTTTVDTLSLTNAALPLEVAHDSDGVGLYFNTSDPNGTPIPGPLPTITTPTTITIPPGAISGISLAENGSTPTETFTATLSDTDGALSVGTAGGSTVSGSGSNALTVTGSLAQLNAALGTLTDTDIDSEMLTINASDSLGHKATPAQVAVNFDPIPSPSTPVDFNINDMNNGITGTSAGQSYTGPVPSLADDIIIATSDNINVTADIPNVFIKTGSGIDALQTDGGTNVLDGSTGSNFLVGNPSDTRDTFFVDDRSPPANIWSTVEGFQSGDSAIVWGLTPADFSSILQTNGQGTAGFTGLTFGLAGPPDVNLTLAGYTETGITQTSQNTWTVAATNPSGMNSTLNISFGTTAPIDGLPSANYMQIQAM